MTTHTAIATKPSHEGRPIVHATKHSKRVLVLCPFRHLVYSMPRQSWAGSSLEAKAKDPNWTVRCYGTLPAAQ